MMVQVRRHFKRRPAQNLFTSCCMVFVITASFYWLTQIEIVLEAYWRGLENWPDRARELLTVLLGYNENLLAAGLYTAAFYGCRRWRFWRRLCALALSLVLLFLVINQVFYVQIYQHLQLSPGDFAGFSGLRLLDSLQSFMGAVFYLNLSIWLVATVLLYRQLVPEQRMEPVPAWMRFLRDPRNRRGLLGAVTALLLVGLLANREREYVHYPAFTLAVSVIRNEHRPPDPAEYDPTLDIYTLRYGAPQFDRTSEQPLLDYFATRQALGRPNVIFVVLESVGALNLFSNGQIDPTIMPNLHGLMQHSVVFPSIYTVFPSSKRSHLALNTGGFVYTWKGDAADGDRYYTGPTLTSGFSRAGYSTGLFSATFMDSENFLTVYRREPFDAFVIPDYADDQYIRTHQVNSWGIDEAEVLRRMLQWIDTLPQDEPFFALFLTSSTHHPYTLPEGYPPRFAGEDDLTRYHNTLHYSDDILGRLVEAIRVRGLAETTVLAVMGDHGEAFGDPHPTNRFHRDYIYEENVRDFLMLIDLTFDNGPLVSQKRGSIGDVAPTLLALADDPFVLEVEADAGEMLGQNLFSPDYQARIHYFHKNSAPEQWGLVDGRWKFIARRLDDPEPELYDLTSDPTEQKNLAEFFPDRVHLYDRLAATWYIRMDRAFLERLSTPQVGGR